MSVAEKYTILTSEKIPDVYKKGKQDEHDIVWNSVQSHNNGVAANYAYKFRAWKREAFYPIKNIKPTTVEYMFAFFGQYETSPFNLKDRLNECNVTLDTSSCTTFNFGFYFTSFSELPHINMSSLTNASYTFAYNTYLKKIEKITVNENAKWTNAFDNDTALEEVYFDGTIGNNINFQSCPLTHESLLSIITALKDYSEDTSGTTHTLTLGSTNIAKLTEEELNIIYEKGWEYK